MNTEENIIYFAKMRADALIPTKEKENAGYDLYASFDEKYILIKPYSTALVPTGIAWACNEGFYMQIEERSSTGLKGIKKSSGIIDSGYRGEIKVAIFNANPIPIVFSPFGEDEIRKLLIKDEKIKDKENFIFYSTSKAIAQGIIHRVEDMQTKEISLQALQSIPSKRGDKGWGSTNIKENLEKLKNNIDKIKK